MNLDPAIELLLAGLDEAFDTKSWHGTNLRGSVRGVTVAQAAWRADKDRHNIREIVVHAAYWKYAVRRVITADKRGSFRLKGSNWFARDGTDPAQWASDLQLLAEEHRRLREAVASFDPHGLDQLTGRRFTYAGLIRGAAAHDVYHAGQIQLLKRLQRGA